MLFLQALGAIGPQALPPAGCAAYLWSRETTPRLVAMAGAEPGTLRVLLGGQPVTLPRTAAEGDAGHGLAATAHYAAGAVSATLALSVVEQPGLTDGALIPDATLTVTTAGQDTVVAPLGGMVGCAKAAGGR